MQIIRTWLSGRRTGAALLLRAALVAGCGLFVCGCYTDQPLITGAPEVSPDPRLRHPITITEAERTLQIFIGANRAALTAPQRAELLAFAQSWRAEATGGVFVDVPTGTANQAAAAGAVREIQSILAATGVPPRSMMVRSYPATPLTFATVRVTYPRVVAQAGPCGMWPQDIGISSGREYYENQQYWNFGCSNQHNLAAMIDNPADLVQPRSEAPAYTMRRTQVVDKYRQGQDTSTQYRQVQSKISDF
jgi:pilus assembly protein CpaD